MPLILSYDFIFVSDSSCVVSKLYTRNLSIFTFTYKTNLNLPKSILSLSQGSRKSEEENLLAENDRMLDSLAGKVSRLKSVC